MHGWWGDSARKGLHFAMNLFMMIAHMLGVERLKLTMGAGEWSPTEMGLLMFLRIRQIVLCELAEIAFVLDRESWYGYWSWYRLINGSRVVTWWITILHK